MKETKKKKIASTKDRYGCEKVFATIGSSAKGEPIVMPIGYRPIFSVEHKQK